MRLLKSAAASERAHCLTPTAHPPTPPTPLCVCGLCLRLSIAFVASSDPAPVYFGGLSAVASGSHRCRCAPAPRPDSVHGSDGVGDDSWLRGTFLPLRLSSAISHPLLHGGAFLSGRFTCFGFGQDAVCLTVACGLLTRPVTVHSHQADRQVGLFVGAPHVSFISRGVD